VGRFISPDGQLAGVGGHVFIGIAFNRFIKIFLEEEQ